MEQVSLTDTAVDPKGVGVIKPGTDPSRPNERVQFLFWKQCSANLLSVSAYRGCSVCCCHGWFIITLCLGSCSYFFIRVYVYLKVLV